MTDTNSAQRVPLLFIYMCGLCVLCGIQAENNEVDMLIALILEHDGGPKALLLAVDGEDSLTPLHVAAGFGSTECVAALIEYHHPIDRRDGKGRTALQYACAWGQVETCRLLLQVDGSDVNAECELDGWTPLMEAMRHRQVEVSQVLLESADIDLDQPDHTGVTALHVAAKYRCKAGVELLLRRRATMVFDDEGRSPLDWAAEAYHSCQSKLHQLQNGGGTARIKSVFFFFERPA